MENPRRSNRGVEENVMAILDSSGVKEARDIDDDRVSFLEAVRAATLAAESPDTPTWTMYDAIFQILNNGTSLELIIASYQLLIELDKRYPRVCLVQDDKSNTLSAGVCELVVAKEGWSPFIVGPESTHSEGGKTFRNSHKLFDPSRFSLLIQEIAQAVNEMDFDLKLKPLKDMLVFQYLVSVMEGDFLFRQNVYKETMNWILLRESLLNTIMVSRRLIFKSLIRDCMSIISRRCHHVGSSLPDLENAEKSSAKTNHDCHVALAISVSEFEKGTCTAVQKLLTLVMELDVIKKQEDVQGSTSRADGSRTPLLEIILDELTYNKDLISPFLQGFSEPKWKLEIILQYLWKYCSKTSVRTRRSNASCDDATFESVLSQFSNAASAKNIGRKITIEVSQLLLAHAFQAYLSLESSLEYVANNGENVGGNSLVQICRGVISAFQNLRGINRNMDIMPLEKETLFTAGSLLSIKS